jgi:hypothetical protein
MYKGEVTFSLLGFKFSNFLRVFIIWLKLKFSRNSILPPSTPAVRYTVDFPASSQFIHRIRTLRLLDALRYAVRVRLQNWIISPSRDAFNVSCTIPKGTGQLYSGSKGCRSVSLINHSHLVPRFRLLLCSFSVHGCSPVYIRAFARLMLGQ